MSNVLELTEQTFESEVLQSEVPVLVDFTATWCGPCKKLSPIIEEIANDYNGKIKVAKVDVDTARAPAARFGVMSVPTVLLFVGGQVKHQVVGAVAKTALTDRIDQVVG
jgi:thioredoxin 1